MIPYASAIIKKGVIALKELVIVEPAEATAKKSVRAARA